MKKMWVYDSQSGGNKIPDKYQWVNRQQADKFAPTRPWSVSYEIKLRFKSQFCYLDHTSRSINL